MDLTKEQEQALDELKFNAREEAYPFFEDEQLVRFLERADWDVEWASYYVVLAKAENDGIRLPSGMVMPNNKRYWQNLAKRFRRNLGRHVVRGDAT